MRNIDKIAIKFEKYQKLRNFCFNILNINILSTNIVSIYIYRF